MVADWFERAPDVERYLLQCDADAEAGRVLTTPLGRQRRFGLVSTENVEDLKKEARNFRIQSIASDMTLHSGIRLQPWLKTINASVVNLVHDSILVECPIEMVDDVILQMVTIMRAVPKEMLNSRIPFDVDVKRGVCWGELKKVELTF